MIRVFASITDKEPAEVHQWAGGVRAWLCANIDDFDPSAPAPFSIAVNGETLLQEQWAREVSAEDVVDITVQPQGVDLLVGAITLRETFRPIINALQPDIPSTPDAGQSLDLASAKANTPRLGGVVPEIFGQYRRYPDYLVPPRKFFASPRRQTNRLFMCIGVGEYDIDISGVKVGESQLTSIDDATYTIYGPGDDVSADPAAEWWHACSEVGGTSTGGAGLQLGGTSSVSSNPSAFSFTFSGDEISIPGGAGSFPAGWDNTLTLRVEQYLNYEIESGGTRDIIRGPLDQLGPFVGMAIEIDGDNSGNYEVHSYTPSVPDDPGSASTLTGNVAPSRYDFDVTPVTFTVTLDGNDQTVTLNTDVVNLSGLVSAINGQLDGSVDAQDDGSGKVELVEEGPNYSGAALTVSGTTTDVFGGSPVAVTGDETTVSAEAEITLSYGNGDPVTGLTPNAARMAIGYEGMRYLVDGATTSTVELTRLTDAGASDGSWPGFDNVTTTDAVIYVTGSSASTGWAGPFDATPAGEITDILELDFVFPGGLAYLSDSGNVRVESQSITVQWRESGTTDPWTSQTFDFQANTLSQIGYTRTINLGSSIRPQVRCRINKGGDHSNRKKAAEWYALRAKLEAPTSYPWTTMSVEIGNAAEISAQSEQQINVVPKRKLPVLVDGEWTAGKFATRDIIPAVKYIAGTVNMPCDDDVLVELDALYKSRGDKFDFVFNETTVRDAIKKALAAGMAELTIDDGSITPVRDGPRSTFEQAFSPQNMVDGLSRSFATIRPDDADGVDIEYTDRDTWTQETIECRLPGDLGNKVETIKLEGVTDRTQAWRIGMRERRKLAYRRWQYSFTTELEGLNAGYMSYVPLLDDIPGYGQSSIMRSIQADGSNAKITVTEDMDWSGTGHVVAFRNEYGELVGPYSATIGNNDREIVAAIPAVDWPDTAARQEPPHVYFGTADKWTFPALVQSVEPSGGLQVGIKAVNYDERVYADDDNSPTE